MYCPISLSPSSEREFSKWINVDYLVIDVLGLNECYVRRRTNWESMTTNFASTILMMNVTTSVLAISLRFFSTHVSKPGLKLSSDMEGKCGANAATITPIISKSRIARHQ